MLLQSTCDEHKDLINLVERFTTLLLSLVNLLESVAIHHNFVWPYYLWSNNQDTLFANFWPTAFINKKKSDDNKEIMLHPSFTYNGLSP